MRWTRLGTLVAALLAMTLVLAACTGTDEACACGGDPSDSPVRAGGGAVGAGPYAVVHGDKDVFIVDTDSQVVDSFTLPEHTEIRQPVAGTVTFLGEDTAWNLDLASGEVDTVRGLPGSGTGLEDGQRLIVESHSEQQGEADEPGPVYFDGLVDVLTGERQGAAELVDGTAEIVDKVGDVVVLDVEGADGLVLLRLDRRVATPVEVPTDDLDQVHLSSDGHTVAVDSGDGVVVGDSSASLTAEPVSEPGISLLGVVGDDALVAYGNQLVRLTPDGQRTTLARDTDTPRLEHPSGLLAAGDEEEPRWYRVTATSVRPLRAVRGMTLAGADESGWWFSTGEDPVSLRRAPLVVVDPRSGEVNPVRGSLAQLSGLAQATGTNDERFRAATFVNDKGFEDLALADARSGRVTAIDVPDDPTRAEPRLAIAPGGRFLASTTVQGPTITTVEGGSTLVVPAFDIDLDPELGWDYHWVVGD